MKYFKAIPILLITYLLALSSMSNAACVPVDLSGAVIDATHFGANGYDDIDDTAQLQAAIDNTPEGGVLWIPAGRYLINAVNWGILPHSDMTIYLSPHAILKAIPNMSELYFVVSLINVQNVVISGGTIRGERDDHITVYGDGGQWGHALAMWESRNITIQNLTVSDSWGDGIYIGNPDYLGTENITICNVTASNNRRQGLSITGANNVLVENSIFLSTNGYQPKSGIDIEPYDDHKVTNVMIRNCQFRYNEGMGITVYRVSSENSKNIIISDNKFVQNEASGIFLHESKGVQITRNLFEDNGGTWDYGWYAGIHLYQSSQILIQQNTIFSPRYNQFGVLFRGYSNFVQLVDNDICVGKGGNSIIDYYFCNSCVYSKNTYCKRQPHSSRDLTMIYSLLLFH